jgi:hypothetical protein
MGGFQSSASPIYGLAAAIAVFRGKMPSVCPFKRGELEIASLELHCAT